MDKDDPRFQVLRSAYDNVFHQLRAQGIRTKVWHAPIITVEEEKLWMTSVINVTTPKGLQRALFYYVGKCFGIHGGQEQ